MEDLALQGAVALETAKSFDVRMNSGSYWSQLLLPNLDIHINPTAQVLANDRGLPATPSPDLLPQMGKGEAIQQTIKDDSFTFLP